MTPWSKATQAAVKEALGHYADTYYTNSFGNKVSTGQQAVKALDLIRQEQKP